MERSEPSLAPEWLKSSGSVTGSGTASRPLSPSDDHAVSKLAKNKSLVNHDDHELRRSSFSDRIHRNSSSNGSGHMRSYSSFGRNQRGRDWDKDLYEPRDREKSVAGDNKHRDYLDLPGNIFPGNFEKDGLRRSQSMVSAKRSEAWPKRPLTDSNTASKSKTSDGNGLLDRSNAVGTLHKASFERDFPSLGSEERRAASEVGRVPSPGLSTAIHGLPISASAMIGGDKWTSALAEVPTIVGSISTGLLSGQQALASSSASLPLSTSTGLNMAETVAQGPPRAQAAPKISSGTQRLEELAIKQSRQLIPVTPSMPKPLVLNSSDKGKSKAGQQQHPVSSPLLSPSLRGGPVKTDASKTTNTGKLVVLKQAREWNGLSTAAKDSLSPTIARAATSGLPVTSSVAGLATARGTPSNPVSPGADRKHVLTVLEKKPTSQAQSRNDFFNLVRKKSMPNSSSGPDAGSSVSASTQDEPGEVEVAPAAVIPEGRDVPSLDCLNGCQPTECKINLTSNDNVLHKEEGHLKNGKIHSTSLPPFSEEEETALLHKLGWQENADEGALTEEEISAFFRDLSKYMNSKPSLKTLQGVQPKFPLLLSSHVGAINAISSGLSSSDSKLES
ncbi:hypothetical protein ACH5RR_022495 [Cinchona calisaya]|uniref:Uncharacterized protein n=1 Tax=Cinchona calisaya TaxID=153742 RepID=A0ABD2Z7Z7_9GENT